MSILNGPQNLGGNFEEGPIFRRFECSRERQGHKSVKKGRKIMQDTFYHANGQSQALRNQQQSPLRGRAQQSPSPLVCPWLALCSNWDFSALVPLFVSVRRNGRGEMR